MIQVKTSGVVQRATSFTNDDGVTYLTLTLAVIGATMKFTLDPDQLKDLKVMVNKTIEVEGSMTYSEGKYGAKVGFSLINFKLAKAA